MTGENAPVEGRVLALDVGDVRIGIAASDLLGLTAQPRESYRRTTPAEDVEAIKRAVAEAEAYRVVVGLPLNEKGETGYQAERVLAFVEMLREALDVEVVTADERFTTAIARRSLIQSDMRRAKRKKVIDAVAAQQILQTYLDRERNRRG